MKKYRSRIPKKRTLEGLDVALWFIAAPLILPIAMFKMASKNNKRSRRR